MKKKPIPKKDPKAETIARRILEKQRELIAEIRKNPVLQVVCSKIGISRSTAYRWAKDDGIFAKAFEDARKEGTSFICDMAESQVIKQIGNGNLTASIFWLKTRKKDEYAEKISHEYKLSGDQPLPELTPELRKAQARGLINAFAPMFSFKMTSADFKEAIKREWERIDQAVIDEEKRLEKVRKALEPQEDEYVQPKNETESEVPESVPKKPERSVNLKEFFEKRKEK